MKLVLTYVRFDTHTPSLYFIFFLLSIYYFFVFPLPHGKRFHIKFNTHVWLCDMVFNIFLDIFCYVW